MKRIVITNDQIKKVNGQTDLTLAKYKSPLLNLSNRFAQSTRPIVVGQLSDLFQEFMSTEGEHSAEKWREWYFIKKPKAIENAVAKIKDKLIQMSDAMESITDEDIVSWVNDLVIDKTYKGLYFQEAILIFVSDLIGKDYKRSTPGEESKGIDGYIGSTPISIKPHTYLVMESNPEEIDAVMIYYSRSDDKIIVTFDEDLL